MNAPFSRRELRASTATLQLYALFHLNLAFSSIEEEQRGEAIRRCYWPLLHLAERHGPLGIEASGYTLEEIAQHDPAWIDKTRALIAAGRIEFIGSGYAQIIGPLVPAAVNEANLRIGNCVYESLLGVRPSLALVNEQTYSAGLVELYTDAGYRAILMDWDNPASQHPQWHVETRYLPQKAQGADGHSIALLWTNTVAFQKLQRFVHGDIELDGYRSYLQSHLGAQPRTLCIYASDAEVFDFRPGRYRTEECLNGEGEWRRLEAALQAVAQMSGVSLVPPSDALALSSQRHGGQTLRLESAACPVPVKKQRKYNLSRWAVTGRDDIGINAACERIYRGLQDRNVDDAAWKELCYLWSSDFRTHITQKRWQSYCARLTTAEERWAVRATEDIAPPTGDLAAGRLVTIETPFLIAQLDRRRGLAIRGLKSRGQPLAAVGWLQHGHFDDIGLQADWYTGDCVFEAPGEPKITDLEWCEAQAAHRENGDVVVTTEIATPKGPIHKAMCFCAGAPRVDFDLTFHWADWGRGSLRLGHVTLLPDAFDWRHLALTTHNGGRTPETYRLAGQTVDHGAPVSFLVSASHGIGMTEGWAEIGDGQRRVRVEVDRETAPLLGLLHHRQSGGSLFCQLMLSALELDETRKPDTYRPGPRRFRFSVSLA